MKTKRIKVLLAVAAVLFWVILTGSDTSAVTDDQLAPKIIGTVKTSSGVGLSGVTIASYSCGLGCIPVGQSVTTDGSGNYNINVPYGSNYTVKPFKTGYTFTPTSRTYNNVTSDQAGQDYTAHIMPVISGSVKTSSGGGVSGVSIIFSDNGGSATTDGSGYYSAFVPSGWSGTATPYKSGCTFIPILKTYSNVIVNQTGEDYTATIHPDQVISGRVTTASGTGLSGVTIASYSCGLGCIPVGQSVTTDGSGNYNINVPYGSNYTVIPFKTGYTFTPTTRTYNNVTSDQAGQDYTAHIMIVISGSVKTSSGGGVSGVSIIFSDIDVNATTDGSGYYSAFVPFGWSGTATPYKSGCTFIPILKTYFNVIVNQAGEDYTATIHPDQVISGRVTTASGTGLSGVTIASYSCSLGCMPVGQSVTTDGSGNYNINVPYGSSYTVKPTITGYTFTPTSRMYNNVTSIQNNQGYQADQVTLSVTPSNQNVGSASGTTSFSVSNTGTGTMLWTTAVTSGDSWLSITSGSSGSNSGTVTCSYSANTSTSNRTATIRITASDATGSPKDVIVTQAGIPEQAVVSVSPSSSAVTKDAGTTTFSISNTGTGTMLWTAAVTSGGSWLSITSGASGSNSGTITCSYSANSTFSIRTATIRITASGATGSPVDVTVGQMPTPPPTPSQPVVSVSPANRDVAKEAGTVTFGVSNTGTGTMPWTASVTSGGSWLSITSGASGSNSGTITCSYSANSTFSIRTAAIRITASGATGSPVDVTVTQAESFDIGLTGPGWNLISLPQQPYDTAIGNVLGSISGKYSSVWAFRNGSWKVFDPAYPGFSDLTTLETGWGYWLNMTESATLSLSGTEPSKIMDLIAGWNLVGYNSSTSLDITNALASIAGKVISVWAYKNNSWQFYDPAILGFSDLTTMAPGYGYWINTNGACTWTLP